MCRYFYCEYYLLAPGVCGGFRNDFMAVGRIHKAAAYIFLLFYFSLYFAAKESIFFWQTKVVLSNRFSCWHDSLYGFEPGLLFCGACEDLFACFSANAVFAGNRIGRHCFDSDCQSCYVCSCIYISFYAPCAQRKIDYFVLLMQSVDRTGCIFCIETQEDNC